MGGEEIKELPPRFIEFPFYFNLLCNKLHWALYQENLNVRLLNDFLVLKELLQTLV